MRWTVAFLVAVLFIACYSDPPGPEARERALLWEIDRALSRDQYLVAVALFDSLQDSRYAPTHYLRGEVHSKLYRFDEAKIAFERALELDPDHRDAVYHLGYNSVVLGKHRQALSHFKRFIEVVHPAATVSDSLALAAGYLRMGNAYGQLGVPDSAEAAYRASVTADPDGGDAWAALAELLDSGGNHASALVAATEAFDRDSTNAQHRLLLGNLHLRLESPQAAEPHLRIAADAMPWDPASQYSLGRCLLILGRERDAEEHLLATDSLQNLASNIVLAEFAVRRNPHLIADWIILSSLYRMVGNEVEARRARLIAQSLNNDVGTSVNAGR